MLAKPNKVGFFMLNKHKITVTPKEFELTKEELAELKTKGPQHWVKEVKANPVGQKTKEE